jgi:hypothetical protein
MRITDVGGRSAARETGREGDAMPEAAVENGVRGRFVERFARVRDAYARSHEKFGRDAANPADAVAWCESVIEAQYKSEAFWVVQGCLERVGKRHGYASDREAVDAGVKRCLDEVLLMVGNFGGDGFQRAVHEAKAAGYAAAVREINDWVL